MRIALIHDYLNEFGGAERVLLALSEIYPKAPIYTAFYKKGSVGYERFKDKKIITSWVHKIPFFAGKLYSPLRFLAPWIWKSFSAKGGLTDYDVVISSASWYITKGFGRRGSERKKPVEICYCHTPPRWLYGYSTSIEWQKYWLVRVYAGIVGYFMRQYDFRAAQRVDEFIANSENVKKRIEKFYRRKAKVIYPPVSLPLTVETGPPVKKDYYLVISRIVGGKGLDLAVKAASKFRFNLKVVGRVAGYGQELNRLKKTAKGKVEFIEEASDEKLVELYSKAKAFLALAKDEDFGITPVEAMLCGTGVVAYKGGGYLETVVDRKTGVFFDKSTVGSLGKAIKRFEKMKIKSEDCVKQARKFSKERFKREIKEFVKSKSNS